MTDSTDPVTRLRNARACEACRLLKSRCVYKLGKEVCQRCEESGSTCLVRAKARPMRNRALRQPAVPNSSLPDNPSFSLNLPSVPSRDVIRDLEDLNSHHKGLFGVEDRSSSSLEQPDIQPLIKQRKLCVEEAEKLLSSFRDAALYFPFVKIPDTTVPLMSRNSPFLLLSLLASSSKAELGLHRQLDHEFKRVLSQKIVVEGQKSLDFLLGLLIYIAWYPVHSNPRHNQTHVYMSMAISLVSELGLDSDLPNSMGFNTIDTNGLVQNGFFTPAAKLAYLGCYCLSSAIQYCNLMDIRSQEFFQDIPSSEVYYTVKLQRFWERISDFYAANNQQIDIQVSAHNPEHMVQIFLTELKEFRETIPELSRNIVSIGILDRFAEVAINSYSLGFFRRPYRVVAETENRPENAARDYNCLGACKAFFEYLLTLPEGTFLFFTTLHWTVFVHCTLVLTRLTFAMASDLGWDSNTTRANIPMIMYLDCLCWRFQSLSQRSDDAGKSPQSFDSLYIFRVVLESLKKSYSDRVDNIRPRSTTTNALSNSRGKCPVLDPDLNAYFETDFSQSSGSYDESGSGTSSNSVPIYFDIWTTMTGSWAEQ